jgi:hypothetical protein
MVRIKFTTHPRTPIVSYGVESMASDEVSEISAQQREASMEQQEEFFTYQPKDASLDAASSCGAESDCESQSGNSGDSKTGSNNSGHLKVAAVAALAGMSYNFEPSTIMKTCVGRWRVMLAISPRDMAEPLAQSSCWRLERTKLSSPKTFSLLGFICYHI